MRKKTRIEANIPTEEPFFLECELDDGMYNFFAQDETDTDKSNYIWVKSSEKDSRGKRIREIKARVEKRRKVVVDKDRSLRKEGLPITIVRHMVFEKGKKVHEDTK